MILETLSLALRIALVVVVVALTVYYQGTLTILDKLDRAVAGAFESVGR